MFKHISFNKRKNKFLKERDAKLAILEKKFRILQLREKIKELVKI